MALALASFLASPAPSAAQAPLNMFSLDDEVEMGRQASEEVERQLPLLRRPKRVERYLQSLVDTLAGSAPGERYDYRVRVVDASDVNAFALPGGFLYVNRGVIEMAESEGELSGVVSHEMAHIALRHGSRQMSRAIVAQSGLEILGGLAGRRNKDAGGIVRGVGGIGAQALFLKYSRGAETEADVTGARMMAAAGYDAMDAARFFERMQQQAGRDPSAVERFLSSHPAPSDRARRLRQEAGRLRRSGTRGDDDEFWSIRAELKRLPPARRMDQITQR